MDGKAFEVIDGIAGIAERIHLLHVEVETAACIGADQKLYSDGPLSRRLQISMKVSIIIAVYGEAGSVGTLLDGLLSFL